MSAGRAIHVKTFRTHDGHYGNRMSVEAWIDDQDRVYIHQIVAKYTPDRTGQRAMRDFVRTLNERVVEWAKDLGVTNTDEGNTDPIFLTGDYA